MSRIKTKCIGLVGLLFLVAPHIISAEPFIAPNKRFVRADIELLANVGIIKTPINTWPLNWGPVLKDLQTVKLEQIDERYKEVYLRVLRLGRKETGNDASFTELRVSAAQEAQLLRSFGDQSREKTELTSRIVGMTSHLAWNLEVTAAPNSLDGDDKHWSGSYLAAVMGNWIVYYGQVEKWWGPGWEHSIILSNNAKPMPAITLQRNYADGFETPLLSWMGPWSMNAFVGELDDVRTIDNAKLLGMSVSFMPLDGLEVGLRRTAQWGGEGRPENFDSFINMFIGLDNCDEGELSCDDLANEPGNQLAGIDLTYRFNLGVPLTAYMQTIGEDEAGYMPSKKAFLWGGSVHTFLFESPLQINLETLETTVDGDGNVEGQPFDGFNVLYEHGTIYRHGYRYMGRSMGATIDNDSKMTSIRLLWQSNEWGSFETKFADVSLNFDNANVAAPGGHSLVTTRQDFNEFSLTWQQDFGSYGELQLKYLKRSEPVNTRRGLFEQSNLGMSWSKRF